MTAGRLSEVVEEGPVIKFGDDYSFDKKSLTAYKSNQGKGDFYDLQCVLFSVQSQNLGSSMDYFKAAKERGITSVKILDRKVCTDGFSVRRFNPQEPSPAKNNFSTLRPSNYFLLAPQT